MAYSYDTRYDPPAPVVPIRLSAPVGSYAVLISALVDTGADLTVLPARLVRDLGLPEIGTVMVRGVDGGRRRTLLYAVRVEVETAVTWCEAVAAGSESLLGRTILNRWRLKLDGPRGMLELR